MSWKNLSYSTRGIVIGFIIGLLAVIIHVISPILIGSLEILGGLNFPNLLFIAVIVKDVIN